MSATGPAIIAVASGKGGTGKTTLAAHLAVAAARRAPSLLLDLDVEAPDALGYFPDAWAIEAPRDVELPVPRLAPERCDGCGRCARKCRFGALVAIGGRITINEALCKACGRCVAACPRDALVEAPLRVGATARRRQGGLDLLEGRLAVGDIRSTAVIEAAKARAADAGAEIQIRDCPPGVSCPATHALQGADFALLVAEPTDFARHDLEAALRLVGALGIPVGVVLNKAGFGAARIEELCARYGAPVLARLDYSRERAASGAAGRLWTDDPDYMPRIDAMLSAALAEAGSGTARGGGA